MVMLFVYVFMVPVLFWARRRVCTDITQRYLEIGMIPCMLYSMAFSLFCGLHATHIALQLVSFLWYAYAAGACVACLEAYFPPVSRLRNFFVGFLLLALLCYPMLMLFSAASLQIFWVVLPFLAAIILTLRIPKLVVRALLSCIVTSLYTLRASGLEHLPREGGVLLLGNHVSFIDWAFLILYSQRVIRFVIHRSYYDVWYLTWLFKCFDLIPIANGASKEALETIHQTLRAGGVVGLFPEGRLTANGQLYQFRTGFERAVADSKAVIIPFYLHGLWGSRLTQAQSHYRFWMHLYQREIILVLGAPLPDTSKAFQVQQKVRELSTTAWQLAARSLPSIAEVWLRCMKHRHNRRAGFTDKGKSVHYTTLITNVLGIARTIKRVNGQQAVGLLLTPSLHAATTQMALLSLGLPLIHFNPAWDKRLFAQQVAQFDIQCVIITRDLASESSAGHFLQQLGVRLCFLESLLPKRSFLRAILHRIMPCRVLSCWYLPHVRPDMVAVYQPLVTSALCSSTGLPQDTLRYTEYTHVSMLATIQQVASVLSLGPHDVMMQVLPYHHVSGLIMGTLLPLVEGVSLVSASEHHPLRVARLIYTTKTTIIFGSAEFFKNMLACHDMHPHMLHSVRLLMCIGDQLSLAVKESFRQRFHRMIYEGHGIYPLFPILSCNLPDMVCPVDFNVHRAYKPNTMGLPLPGYAIKVVDPERLEDLPPGEQGLIMIGAVEPQQAGLVRQFGLHWHLTDWYGFLDAEGHLSLIDFANEYIEATH